MRRFAAAILPAAALLAHAIALEPPANAGKHWAFQPLRDSTPPAVKNTAWYQTDLDRFIAAKLEASGRSPAPPADPRTLIRRMTFDLTGLPPTFEEVEAFSRECSEQRTAAIQKLTERLLASPRYGEKWGRHWLDVARYSDTKGYVYGREERFFVHAPAYRDWVIRAFNEDLPYDRFLLLQIAADQLAPAGSPDLAAMGFLTGGRRFLGVTHDIIDDRIDVVTRGTMALTVSCARCHDHKYDPIPIEDYYSLYGVFHGADDRLVPIAALPADAELEKRRKKFTDTMAKRRAEADERLRARTGDYLAAQLELKNYPEEGFDQFLGPGDLIPMSVRRWRDFLHQTKAQPHPIVAVWHALAALPAADFEKSAPQALETVLRGDTVNARVKIAFATPPKTMREAAERYGKLFTAVEDEWKAALADAKQQKGAAPSILPDPAGEELRQFLHDPHSPACVPDTGPANNEFFFPTPVCEELWKLEGEVDRRLIELSTPHARIVTEREPEPNPRVFKRGSAARLGDEVPRQFLEVLAGPQRHPFQNGSGRLELARAIADPKNPLTARVMVNRIWQHHFGTGLVKTPSDFGLRAEPPEHPELLDWLALRFIESGWSVKAMHRLIVSSATYQSTGAARRLEFEQLRDGMLAVSGELDLTAGGKPAELLAPANKRRTVYALVDRQFLPGTFRVFDFANPDLHVATRHETTVPQQALFFLNHAFAADRARTLATRTASASPEDRVRQIHRALFQRDATSQEITRALRFIANAETEAAPATAETTETSWRYGVGEYDETAHRVKSFTPLPHFTGAAWQGAAQFPGGATGWAQLTAAGGHPGNTRAHACIRRWIAPRDLTVSIAGALNHEPEPGDGVRAFIVSSRHGELKSATPHHSKADLTIERIELKAGDMLDFIVDIGGTLSHDQFLWSPVITAPGATWDAQKDFTGPPPPTTTLEPWAQYAQVLLLTNEFAFVD